MSPLSRTLLAFAAGFVDTATYVHLGGLFAAHVTGNFVVFAAALTQGVTAEDFLKLATFPVFVMAVLIGTMVYERVAPRRPKSAHVWILGLEALLLLLCGVTAFGAQQGSDSLDLGSLDVVLAVVLVIAMGLQNSVHRFVPGPMTTVMTGNVTQFTTLIGRALFGHRSSDDGERKDGAWGASTALLLGFAGGCVASAFATARLGLAGVLVCAGLVGAVVIVEGRSREVS